MRNVILLLASISIATQLKAQDIITRKNGDDVKAKVLEVGVSEVKYKKQESPNGATYTLLKSDILMIRYNNGTKDIFGNENATDQSKVSANFKTEPIVNTPTATNQGMPTKNAKVFIKSKDDLNKIEGQEMIKRWDYFNVVDDWQEADYYIEIVTVQERIDRYKGYAKIVNAKTGETIYKTDMIDSLGRWTYNAKKGIIVKILKELKKNII